MRRPAYEIADVFRRYGPAFQATYARLLGPLQLLRHLQAIEQAHGRVRGARNAPRTLDLDLLAYGDLEMRTDTLVLPHPRAHQRAFVLRPLAEIDPGLSLPGLGAIGTWLVRVADQAAERLPDS